MDEFHHEVGHVVVYADVVDGNDVGVGQPRHGTGLTIEPGYNRGIFQCSAVEHLDRDRPVQALVEALPDLGHATATEQGPEPVSPGNQTSRHLTTLTQLSDPPSRRPVARLLPWAGGAVRWSPRVRRRGRAGPLAQCAIHRRLAPLRSGQPMVVVRVRYGGSPSSQPRCRPAAWRVGARDLAGRSRDRVQRAGRRTQYPLSGHAHASCDPGHAARLVQDATESATRQRSVHLRPPSLGRRP